MKHGFFFFCNYIIESLEWNPSSVKNSYFKTILCKCLFPIDYGAFIPKLEDGRGTCWLTAEYSRAAQSWLLTGMTLSLFSTNVLLKQFSRGEHLESAPYARLSACSQEPPADLPFREPDQNIPSHFLLIFHKRVQQQKSAAASSVYHICWMYHFSLVLD